MNNFWYGFVAGVATCAIIAHIYNFGEHTACSGSGFSSHYCQCMITVGLLKDERKP